MYLIFSRFDQSVISLLAVSLTFVELSTFTQMLYFSTILRYLHLSINILYSFILLLHSSAGTNTPQCIAGVTLQVKILLKKTR